LIDKPVVCCAWKRTVGTTVPLLLLVVQLVFVQAAWAEDSFDVSGRAVVFFGPTQDEYDALSEQEQEDMNEILSDFYFYQHNVVPFLEANGIEDFHTANPVIRVVLSENESRTFRRRRFGHTVGLIMIDGAREPVVSLGVSTDVDWIPMFKVFFNIE
jgi:hypothetical protein